MREREREKGRERKGESERARERASPEMLRTTEEGRDQFRVPSMFQGAWFMISPVFRVEETTRPALRIQHLPPTRLCEIDVSAKFMTTLLPCGYLGSRGI